MSNTRRDISDEIKWQVEFARRLLKTAKTDGEFYEFRQKIERAKAGEKVFAITVDEENRVHATLVA